MILTTDKAFEAFFESKGWTVLDTGVPHSLGWQTYGLWNRETGIRMYATAPTKLEAASKMVLRFTGLTPEPSTGSLEGLKTAMVNLRHVLAARNP